MLHLEPNKDLLNHRADRANARPKTCYHRNVEQLLDLKYVSVECSRSKLFASSEPVNAVEDGSLIASYAGYQSPRHDSLIDLLSKLRNRC